jgi:phosphoglycolate phosphatase-like HAD superfamily hydrolase
VSLLLWRSLSRHLTRHPWQLALSVLGIAMGVAVVIAVDLANASARRSFDLSMERIAGRREALRKGELPPQEMLVPYSYDILHALCERGVQLYVASGTDEHYVLEEARLLGLDKYFGSRIYGARDDYRTFSKAKVITRILEENQVPGSSLIGFGDGYVEIQNVKEAGGTAVAVASDESGRSGKADLWKRDRLIGVGADLVIPDYRDHAHLLAYLWNELPRRDPGATEGN